MGLLLGDVTVLPGRGLLLIRRSKTDQRGAGQEVAVWANPGEPGLCPLTAYRAWQEIRDKGTDVTGCASDAGLPLFVEVSKAGRLGREALSDKAV